MRSARAARRVMLPNTIPKIAPELRVFRERDTCPESDWVDGPAASLVTAGDVAVIAIL